MYSAPHMFLRRRQIAHIGGLLLGVLVLSIAIIGHIPTSKCHCHETKQTKQTEQKLCPFGQLRSLSSFLIEPSPPAVEAISTDLCEVEYNLPEYKRPFFAEYLLAPCARGPPRLA